VTTFSTCQEDSKDILCPRPAGAKRTTARETDTAASTSASGGQQGSRRGCGRSGTRTECVRGQSR